MADVSKKYTLVQAANGKYYAVTDQPDDSVDLTAYQSGLDGAVQTTEQTVSNLLAAPLGSGVRVKVPKIFD
jgi:hypothetical protein